MKYFSEQRFHDIDNSRKSSNNFPPQIVIISSTNKNTRMYDCKVANNKLFLLYLIMPPNHSTDNQSPLMIGYLFCL